MRDAKTCKNVIRDLLLYFECEWQMFCILNMQSKSVVPVSSFNTPEWYVFSINASVWRVCVNIEWSISLRLFRFSMNKVNLIMVKLHSNNLYYKLKQRFQLFPTVFSLSITNLQPWENNPLVFILLIYT